MSVDSNLGPYRPRPKGEFSSTENYRYLDIVSYNGGSYININLDTIDGVSCIGVLPEGSPSSKSYWMCLAKRGEPGFIKTEYLPIKVLDGDVWDFSITDKIYVPENFTNRLNIINVKDGDCGALITKNTNLLLPVDSDYSIDFNYVNITSSNEYYLYTFIYANTGFGSRFAWNRTVMVKS